MEQIQQHIAELQIKAKEYHDALTKHLEENKDGSALNQAMFHIAQMKGLTQLSPPPSGSKGKQPPRK